MWWACRVIVTCNVFSTSVSISSVPMQTVNYRANEICSAQMETGILLQFGVAFNKRFASLIVLRFCCLFIFSFFKLFFNGCFYTFSISMGTTVNNKYLQVKIKSSTDTAAVYFVFVMISFMNLYMVSYFLKIVSCKFYNSMAFLQYEHTCEDSGGLIE